MNQSYIPKAICFLMLVVQSLQTSAQKYFIPFVDSNKMYLINEEDKKVISKTYDDLYWKEGAFFIGSNIATDISPEHQDGSGLTHYDIIYNGRIILEHLPFDQFYIVNKKLVMIKNFSFHKPELQEEFKKYGVNGEDDILLFNSKGEQIFKSPLKHLEIAGKLEPYQPEDGSYKCLVIRTTDLAGTSAIYLYDNDAEKLTQTVLDKASDIREVTVNPEDGNFTYKVKTSSDVWEARTFHFSGGKFKPGDAKKIAAPTPGKTPGNEEHAATTNVWSENADPDFNANRDSKNNKRQAQPWLQVKGDSVLLYPDQAVQGNARLLLVVNGQQNIVNERSAYFNGIIYQEKNRSGIINFDGIQPAVYDSLFYTVATFFVAKQDHKWGLINDQQNQVIPIVYDSLSFSTDEIKLDSYGIYVVDGSANSAQRNKYLRFSNIIKVYKNGKTGWYQANGSVILPPEFDFIAENKNIYSPPQAGMGYIAKKGAEYYGLHTVYGNMTQKSGMAYQYIPQYYYNDYYNVKGLKIIALYDTHNRFKGFQSANGKRFYK